MVSSSTTLISVFGSDTLFGLVEGTIQLLFEVAEKYFTEFGSRSI